MAGTGLSPEWDRWFDETFTDLVSGDDDLVRAEFDALIEATWHEPPPPGQPPAPPVPPGSEPDDRRPTGGPTGTDDHIPTGHVPDPVTDDERSPPP